MCTAKGTISTAPVVQYPTPAGLFETVAIDFFQLHKSHEGSTYVFQCIDDFSRYGMLAPFRNMSAPIVTHALVLNVSCSFTAPKVLLGDNDPEFKNEVVKSNCHQYIRLLLPPTTLLVMVSLKGPIKKGLSILRHATGQLQEV